MKIMQKKRVIALLLVVVLVLSFASCGRKRQNDTTAPITNPPTPVETEPPVTEPAETDPPETEPVETDPPITETAEPETTDTEPVETEPAETEPFCEHEFYPKAKVVIPTCKEEGYTEYTCKLCDEKVKDNFKPIVAHLYVKQVISYASCTTDGLEAMVCTYCGETKPEEQIEEHVFRDLYVVDGNYIYGKCLECGIESMILEDYWLKPDSVSYFTVNGDYRYNFADDFSGWNSSNPYQMEFTVTFNGFNDVSSANNKNMMRFNNYNNSILRQYVFDDNTVEIKGNDDYQTHLVNLKVGESATFRFWVEPESDTIAIYINDKYIMTRYDEQFQFEQEPGLRFGHAPSYAKYTISDMSIIRPLVEREYELGFVPAYGHSIVYKTFDAPTLTHHKIRVGECDYCGEIFEAQGIIGEEHQFTLVERVADDETAAGFKIYGYEVFKCGCGYVLTVSSNHEDGHFYEVDIYTGKYKCRCGSVYVGEFDKAHNGNKFAGVNVGKGESNE